MTTNRPFRFGVTSGSADSRQEWVDRAKKLEALGYGAMTVPDHLPDRLAVVPAVMAAAMATETLRIGSWVFCNDFRHPAVLYKEAATIDMLSDGRFELGIGAGWMKTEYDMAGFPFDAPGVRVSRMEEAVRVVKGLAAEGPLHHDGEFYSIDGLEGFPKPVQRPYPPIYIGGGGKRLLSFAAREADIVGIGAKALPEGGLNAADITAESVGRKSEWITDAAGTERDPERNILVYGMELTDDPQGAAGRLAADMPGISAEDVLASPHFLAGSVTSMIEELQGYRERFGLSYITLNTGNAGHIDTFAPVVKELAGT